MVGPQDSKCDIWGKGRDCTDAFPGLQIEDSELPVDPSGSEFEGRMTQRIESVDARRRENP